MKTNEIAKISFKKSDVYDWDDLILGKIGGFIAEHVKEHIVSNKPNGADCIKFDADYEIILSKRIYK